MQKELEIRTIIITGGAGFIGSNFVRYVLEQNVAKVVVVDKLTYAGHKENLEDVSSHPAYQFVEADIADRNAMRALFQETEPDAIVNLAAETHVDRSIEGPGEFIQTNVVGTFELLEAARHYLKNHPDKKDGFRFLHVSTDEVYGTLGDTGLFSEATPYSPNSPYSASKAAADHLVRAYSETYGLPTLITNCSNNYGPFQYPEKLIPLMVLNALEGKKLPVYGDGGNVRDWLFVEDHCIGIWTVLTKAKVGEKYNIGGLNEWTNIKIVQGICDILEKLKPARENKNLVDQKISSYRDLITFVPDRPGHDRRYAIDAGKIQKELGWKPRHSFETGLKKTIQWYLDHRSWCDGVQAGTYDRGRLGLLK